MQMEHIVEIEKVIAGGKGLARLDTGKVIMTDFVLPGETVQLRELKQYPGYIEGQLVEIITPSATRIRPGCVYFEECGGCDLQHADYPEQLKIKKAIVKEAIDRVGILLPENGVQDIISSPAVWGYRYRLRLKIDRNGQLGFFKKRSNHFVAISKCPVATEHVNAALANLQTTGCLKELAGNCNEVELLQSPLNDKITLVLLLKIKQTIPAAELQTISDCAYIDCISGTTGKKYYPLVPQEPAPLAQKISLPDLQQGCSTLYWSGGCFSQVNARQNGQLIRLACDLAGELKGKTVLDLYCGMGNFSIPLALQGAAVTGIEQNPESIRWARFNAESAGVVCSFFVSDVLNSLRELTKNRQRVDIIILDPPRRGIGKAANLLPGLKPQQIIYISCDPATLARDLASLCDRGYSLDRLIPVDMFPQTHHIESVALLEKN
jgi:23S rRNA (uracil1939-C5)-methyltransferase